MLSKKAIRSILTDKPAASNDADWLHECLCKVEEIKQQVAAVDSQISTEKQKHKQAVACLEITRKSIQDKCPHWDCAHHQDPSGGSDSFTECNICGKEL